MSCSDAVFLLDSRRALPQCLQHPCYEAFEFEALARAPLELTFSIYADVERWRNRSVFGDIRWVKGTPGAEGSRLQVETRSSVPSKVDQVVQHFPPTRVLTI